MLVPIEDVLLSDPGVWLPQARSVGPAMWRTSVGIGPIHREVVCTVGPLRDEPGSLWREMSWEPVSQLGAALPLHEALPTFAGEIGLHRSRAVLVLNGTYDVPGGRLGELTDALGLSGLARATANRLLVDVSRCAVPSTATI